MPFGFYTVFMKIATSKNVFTLYCSRLHFNIVHIVLKVPLHILFA